jgi:hypothetical protein
MEILDDILRRLDTEHSGIVGFQNAALVLVAVGPAFR